MSVTSGRIEEMKTRFPAYGLSAQQAEFLVFAEGNQCKLWPEGKDAIKKKTIRIYVGSNRLGALFDRTKGKNRIYKFERFKEADWRNDVKGMPSNAKFSEEEDYRQQFYSFYGLLSINAQKTIKWTSWSNSPDETTIPIVCDLDIAKQILAKDVNEIRKKLGLATETDESGHEQELEEDAVAAAEQAKSQGFQFDSELRKKIENRAMDAASRHFKALGFNVVDCSSNHPFDLKCIKGSEILYVEVKGTQSDGSEIILTHGEVEFNRAHPSEMALFILHSIEVTKSSDVTGGKESVVQPWNAEQDNLTPLSYMYRLQ